MKCLIGDRLPVSNHLSPPPHLLVQVCGEEKFSSRLWQRHSGSRRVSDVPFCQRCCDLVVPYNESLWAVVYHLVISPAVFSYCGAIATEASAPLDSAAFSVIHALPCQLPPFYPSTHISSLQPTPLDISTTNGSCAPFLFDPSDQPNSTSPSSLLLHHSRLCCLLQPDSSIQPSS